MSVDRERDFAEFYEATWSRTAACAYAISGDLASAEDAAQEAYARAWQRWATICKYDEPAAWVRQVAARLAISRWRRRRTADAFRARTRPPDPTPGPGPDHVALVAALQTLPVAQRRAIVLHHLAGVPVREIAELEHCPEGTVKARLSRGREALAPLLTDAPNVEVDHG